MNLKNIQEDIITLGIDKAQINALLNLIDKKIDNDMDKIIAKMEAMNSGMISEMKRVEDKIDTRTTMILWAIGIMIALILGLKLIT